MPNRAEAVELVRIARELHNWVNRRYQETNEYPISPSTTKNSPLA